MCAIMFAELKRDRFDERSCSGSRTSSRGREDPGGEAKKKTAPGMLNNRFCREMEKGALGLSQDRMALVREKKDEIEKVSSQRTKNDYVCHLVIPGLLYPAKKRLQCHK